MSDEHKPLTDLLNKTGYPLQVGLKHQITATRSTHSWHVKSVEHAWHDPATDKSGFIDLVIRHDGGASLIVIECKHVHQQPWCFLEEDQLLHTAYKQFTFRYPQDDALGPYWKEMNYVPGSSQSKYFTVKDKGTSGKPYLDSLASELITATESYAMEYDHLVAEDSSLPLFFASMIVTTADLFTAAGDPTTVLANNGIFTDLTWKPVKWLRYRKQLSTRESSFYKLRGPNGLERWKERTVMVVNANYFIELLSEWGEKHIAGLAY